MAIIFDKYPLSGRYYGGTEKKLGILINGCPYMLKFPKKLPIGKINSHISEHLGSRIYALLGVNSQETILGSCGGEECVACKDFLMEGDLFVPFNELGEMTLEMDREKFQYTYEDIEQMLVSNQKLTKRGETISTFFDMYIIDALIGNFDRHGSNWGFIKRGGNYLMAPVFDNGSCLFPRLIDEERMLQIMNDEEETNRRIYSFPTSQIKLNGKKSSYYEVISSLKYEGVVDALRRITPKVDLGKINSLIESIDIISEIHKKFYEYIIEKRYLKILKEPYERGENEGVF